MQKMKLPSIINIKDKFSDNGYPYELLLIDKIYRNLDLDINERIDFKNLIDFYFSQINFFKHTVPSKLSNDNVLLLESHFRKVFGISFLLSNDIHSNTFYRAVVNKSIQKDNKRIELIRHLGNPPKEIIKSKGEYGRANTPENTILYVSIDEASTMTEIEYEIGDLITVSKWRQIKAFKVLPIVLDSKYKYQQEYIIRSRKAYQMLKDTIAQPLYDLFLEVNTFLSDEFSKRVTNHLDHLYSANYALNVFNNELKSKSSPTVGFLYPGVGCDYKNFNLAFEPRLIGDSLRLIGVKEIKIEEKFDFRSGKGDINQHDTTGLVTGFKNGMLIWNN